MNSIDATTGMQLARMGHFAEALPHLEKANRQAPADVELLQATTSLLVQAGRANDAAERYRVAAALQPDNVAILVGWARVAILLNAIDQAVGLLDKALSLQPRIAEAGGLLSMIWRPYDPDTASDVLHRLALAHPTNADLSYHHAQALQVAQRIDDARRAFETYRDLRPEDPLGHVELGRLAVGRGEPDVAQDHFRAALAIDPDYPRAVVEVAQAQRGALDAATVEQVQRLLSTARDPADAAALHDILSRHHEKNGDFRASAEQASRMNTLQEQMTPPSQRYRPEQHALEVDVAIENQDASFFERLRGSGSADPRPVFVIGLPRSGTTLLERMLASHPRMIGVGEQSLARPGLQRALAASGDLLRSLTPPAVREAAQWHLRQLDDRIERLGLPRTSDRIVDKMPDNYLLAGWLSIAFPNAAIVHVLRDPRDVALSCWLTQFARLPWAFRLEHIAHRIEQHRRLMRHWRSVIGDRITELRYERLVADSEHEMGRVLAAIGVEWNPDVLDFAERKGFVGSASRHQVRESLHARSVERWRNYDEALQPIMARLDAVVAQDAREATSDLRL